MAFEYHANMWYELKIRLFAMVLSARLTSKLARNLINYLVVILYNLNTSLADSDWQWVNPEIE